MSPVPAIRLRDGPNFESIKLFHLRGSKQAAANRRRNTPRPLELRPPPGKSSPRRFRVTNWIFGQRRWREKVQSLRLSLHFYVHTLNFLFQFCGRRHPVCFLPPSVKRFTGFSNRESWHVFFLGGGRYTAFPRVNDIAGVGYESCKLLNWGVDLKL